MNIQNRVLKGQIGEYGAVAWLLSEDYQVFKNVSPHGAFDIIAISPEDKLLKIDVKTVTWSKKLECYSLNENTISKAEEVGATILYTVNGKFAWSIDQLNFIIENT